MRLSVLLKELQYTCLRGSEDIDVAGVAYDSRRVETGSLFICIRGALADGHEYAGDAVAKGAAALVVQEPVEVPEGVTVILVEDTRYALSLISAAWFDYPARKLKTIGVTGTKGKTTTTYMIQSILEAAGHKV